MEQIIEKLNRLTAINKTFAEFMGYEIIAYKGDSNKLIYNGNRFARTIGEEKALWGGLSLQFTGRFVEYTQFPFNTDFNYLIPIIKRIEEAGYVVAIKGISYQVYGLLQEDSPIVGLVCGDLSKKTEMVCALLVEFIEREINQKA